MSTQASQKPYMIRALWQWCTDLGHTPQIMVAIDARTRVPKGYDDNGKIVLDVSMEATQGLDMGNEWIQFSARFGEVAHQIDIPVGQVVAIFAAETGEGMGFEVDETVVEVETPIEPAVKASPLKIVK